MIMARFGASLMNTRVVPIVFRRHYSLREDIRKFREPDKPKKHMLAACQPYIKRVYKEDSENCGGPAKQLVHELGPLERILCEELLEDLKKSDFILFVQYNYTKFQSDRVYKNTLTKCGGKFHNLNNRIYEKAFGTLKRNDVLPLLITRNALISGQIDNLKPCIKALDKMPQYLLLAGIIEDHLYRHNQLQSIAAAVNLETSRANLLATLHTPALNLSTSLQTLIESSSESGDKEKS